ncbi:hypothetical protein VTK56DRAFT_81 [Thermocarpiscus australiensis]
MLCRSTSAAGGSDLPALRPGRYQVRQVGRLRAVGNLKPKDRTTIIEQRTWNTTYYNKRWTALNKSLSCLSLGALTCSVPVCATGTRQSATGNPSPAVHCLYTILASWFVLRHKLVCSEVEEADLREASCKAAVSSLKHHRGNASDHPRSSTQRL